MDAAKHSELLFDELCLRAAEELEKAYLKRPFNQEVLKTLARRLREIIVEKSVPDQTITVEQLGLVWDIVLEATGPETTDFEQFKKGAEDLALRLEHPTGNQTETRELFNFCLSLHDASISITPIREVPLEPQSVVTFA